MVGGLSGAREELVLTGSLGPVGVDLIYKTVRQVARIRNLPAPTDFQTWTPDAIMESAHDFLADRGPQRLVDLAVRSTDEKSFRTLLWTAVFNHLISAGRRTERGRLSERIKDVLPSVEGLIQEGRTVHLNLSSSVADMPLRLEELVTVASRVPIVVPPWNPNSSHRGPLADLASLVAVIRAVLTAAPGGIEYSMLVSILAIRLQVNDSPTSMDVGILDLVASIETNDPAIAAGAADSGARLVSQLSPNERLVLPYLGESATTISAYSGLGRTKAWETASLLRSKLLAILEDDQSPETTLGAASTQILSRRENE